MNGFMSRDLEREKKQIEAFVSEHHEEMKNLRCSIMHEETYFELAKSAQRSKAMYSTLIEFVAFVNKTFGMNFRIENDCVVINPIPTPKINVKA